MLQNIRRRLAAQPSASTLVLNAAVLLVSEASRGLFVASLFTFTLALLEGNPERAESLNAVNVALYNVGRLIAAPLLGVAADRISFRATYVAALSIATIGHLMYLLAEVGEGSVMLMIASRFIVGIGSGTLGVARAVVPLLTRPQSRTTWYAMLSAAKFVGYGLTPVLAISFGNPPPDAAAAIRDGPHADAFTIPAILLASVSAALVPLLLWGFDPHLNGRSSPAFDAQGLPTGASEVVVGADGSLTIQEKAVGFGVGSGAAEKTPLLGGAALDPGGPRPLSVTCGASSLPVQGADAAANAHAAYQAPPADLTMVVRHRSLSGGILPPRAGIERTGGASADVTAGGAASRALNNDDCDPLPLGLGPPATPPANNSHRHSFVSLRDGLSPAPASPDDEDEFSGEHTASGQRRSGPSDWRPLLSPVVLALLEDRRLSALQYGGQRLSYNGELGGHPLSEGAASGRPGGATAPSVYAPLPSLWSDPLLACGVCLFIALDGVSKGIMTLLEAVAPPLYVAVTTGSAGDSSAGNDDAASDSKETSGTAMWFAQLGAAGLVTFGALAFIPRGRGGGRCAVDDLLLLAGAFALTAVGAVVLSNPWPEPQTLGSLTAGSVLVWSLATPVADVAITSCFSLVIVGRSQGAWMGYLTLAGSVGRIALPLFTVVTSVSHTLVLSAALSAAAVPAVVAYQVMMARRRAQTLAAATPG